MQDFVHQPYQDCIGLYRVNAGENVYSTCRVYRCMDPQRQYFLHKGRVQRSAKDLRKLSFLECLGELNPKPLNP